MLEPVPEHKLLLHLTIHPKTLFLSHDTLHRGYRLRIGFLGFRGSQQFTECTHILSDIRAHDLAVLSRNAVRSQTDGVIVRIRFHVCAEEELNSIIVHMSRYFMPCYYKHCSGFHQTSHLNDKDYTPLYTCNRSDYITIP